MKIVILIFICVFCFTTTPTQKVYANDSYARAVNPTNLYKLSTNSDIVENIICIVEKSYFVKIISDNGDNYKVNYNGILGYVKKDDVKLVNNTPNTPYPNNIKITIGSNCNLRATPNSKSNTNNIITTIYSGETDITFLGRIFSEEAIDFGGTTWYYVKYKGEYGYVYNKYIKSITPIYENTEEIPYKEYNNIEITNPISHTPNILIMIILFIPCLLILLILYYPRKNKSNQKTKKLKKVKEKY